MKFRHGVILALTLAVSALTAPVHAQSDVYQLDIQAQPLSGALKALADQTGVQVVFFSEVTQGEQSPAVTGDYSIEQALDAMLADTGLVYEYLGEDGQSVTVRRPAPDTTGQRRPGIEEIIVTGQKREERIQDVPIAISAFTQEDLKVSQIAGGPDLHLQVPNMTFTKTNFTGYSIQIRGIGTQAISATTDPAVAVALNQTPFIRNRFFEQEFYDLERVEVLRGPQGTLFGRNATAGVVNLITAKPKFQQESMLSFDKGNFDSKRWEAMINVPLVDDRMALRLAGAGTERDGYAVNEITDSPIDGRDLWSTRASLRFAPNDRLDMNLIWEHFEEEDDRLRSGKQLCTKDVVTQVGDIEVQNFAQGLLTQGISAAHIRVQPRFSQGCKRGSLYSEEAFQTPNGASVPYYVPLAAIGLPATLFDPYASQVQSIDLRVIESTVDPEYRARSDIGQMQISYQLTDTLTLDSETAYSSDEIFSKQDFNRFNTVSGAFNPFPNANIGDPVGRGILDENGVFCDPQIGCADRMVAIDVSTAESTHFSQELRLSSAFDGPFNFSLGANYLRYDTEDKYYVFINSLTLTALKGGSLNLVIGDIITAEDPYVPGEADINSACLIQDFMPQEDALGGSSFDCVFVEPNSIDDIQDLGHNYFLSKNPYDLDSYAIFGETYWNVTDALKLTAGLRWSVDKKTAPLIPSQLFVAQFADHPTLEVIEQEWTEPTGRLVLDWKPTLGFTDETLVYGSYSRGYKAGGSNPPPFNTSFSSAEDFGGVSLSKLRPKTFDAEFVNAFELGTKNTLADGAATLNLAAFYYDYTDYQISEIVDRQAFNQNYDAEVWGGEIEADWWVRENLRLGFKGGYQRTRIADGETAVDLMDRTAGGKHFFVTDAVNPNFDPSLDPRPLSEFVTDVPVNELPPDQEFFAYEDWVVVRPFPTFPSSCILPAFIFTHFGSGFSPISDIGQGGNSPTGACEFAYFANHDPVTDLPYVPNPTEDAGFGGIPGLGSLDTWDLGTYPGWNPETAPNNGQGFAKDLGGNELPNAPRYTATVTGDYLIPLKGDWLATLHTDIYWQDESWWRIFNDHEFSRLEDYFTMNLAAIFTNERSGWDIMAYIKNVTDETAITGAFLNSDDTALATNVFLTEPRLYGLRVTKRWGDGEGPSWWLGGAAALLGKEPGEPTPFALTLGGQLLRPKDSPNEIAAPTFITAFDPNIAPSREQGEKLDWGDGREIVLTYAPENGWRFSLGARFGESNRDERRILRGDVAKGCGGKADEAFDPPCSTYNLVPPGDVQGDYYTRTNYGISDLREVEEHLLIDFTVGRDVGLGLGFDDAVESRLSAGVRYAHFQSRTDGVLSGIPDWQLPAACVYTCKYDGPFNGTTNNTQHHEYDAALDIHREFEGIGPTATWEASMRLLGDARGGHVDLDWSVSGGVLFGKQTVSAEGHEASLYYDGPLPVKYPVEEVEPVSESTSFQFKRRKSATVPTLGAGLGLSYRIGGGSVSAGYNWERYFDVIDGGFRERKEFDRTIDGPYLKVTFGGE